jgi:2-haloalkanoic acid dehalogenase type II
VRKDPRFTHLTFDCYGTLIDWRAGIERELVSALGGLRLSGQELLSAYIEAEKSRESEYRKYRDVLRETVISMSSTLGVPVTDTAAREFAGSVPRWPPFPDTSKFLRDMGSRGFKRYILSNVDNDILEETIRRHGLEVDGFVTAEEVGSYKPRPGHWERLFQKTGARREGVLHVAQSVYHDIIPSQEMGLASAWVNRYHEPMPTAASPTFVTDSLTHLAELLDGTSA